MVTTWFFALYTFLVMILAGPVHQESIVEPLKGRFSYPTADEKTIKYRRVCGFCGRGNTHGRAQCATESADCEVLNDSKNVAAFFVCVFYRP